MDGGPNSALVILGLSADCRGSVRPHRTPQPGARDHRACRDKLCPSRRSQALQTALADRAVLQREPQDPPLPQNLRERRAYPGLRRPHTQNGAGHAKGRSRSPSPASSGSTSCTNDRQPKRTNRTAANRHATDEPGTQLMLNRTVVGSTRGSFGRNPVPLCSIGQAPRASFLNTDWRQISIRLGQSAARCGASGKLCNTEARPAKSSSGRFRGPKG